MDNNNKKKWSKSSIILVGILFISSIVIVVAQSNVVNLKDYIRVQIVSPLESNGAIPVNIQDQTSDLVDLYLTYQIAPVNLTQNTSIDDSSVIISSGTAPIVGNMLCLKEGIAFYQGFILTVTSLGGDLYNVSLDSPLDFNYTIDGGCSIREHDLSNFDGSTNVVEFFVSPFGLEEGTRWDIVRIMFYAEGDSEMDDGQFGNIPELTKGLIIRKEDGTHKNLFNIKTNGEFSQRAYDVRYTSSARPPSGTSYSMTTRRTFGGQEKNGIVIRLNGDTQDELAAIIQDDLTDLNHFHIIAQGHVVTD